MKLQYFSWLRSEIGFAQQNIDLPSNVQTMADLITFLCHDSDGHKKIFANPSVINISLNSQLIKDYQSTPIKNSDNISFFSPMAGG